MDQKEQLKNKKRCIVVSIGDPNEAWDCEPFLYREIVSVTIPKKKMKAIKEKIVEFIKTLEGATDVYVPKMSSEDKREGRELEKDLYRHNKEQLNLNDKDARELAHDMTSGFRDGE